MRTITIDIINEKAVRLLQDLEELHLIKMTYHNPHAEGKLSDKYRGVFSEQDAKSFNEHTQIMRGEWENI